MQVLNLAGASGRPEVSSEPPLYDEAFNDALGIQSFSELSSQLAKYPHARRDNV